MIRQPATPHKDAVIETTGGGAATGDPLARDVARACARIAPLWPLEHFVAVNPFLGHTGERFEAAGATLARVTGARMLMPRSFYAGELAAGRITDADLAQAIAAREAGHAGLLAADPREALPTVAALRAAAASETTAAASAVRTVADTADAVQRTRWSAAITAEVAKVCAGYYDRGQSAWRMPARDLPLYAAWRETAAIDRNLEAAGLSGCRAYVSALPAHPLAAIRAAIAELALPPVALADYLHRALASVGGWAGYVRCLVWNDALYGRENDALVHLLAIRIAYDGALLAAMDDDVRDEWRIMTAAMAHPRITQEAALAANAIDALLHTAYESAHQRRLLAMLAAAPKAAAPTAAAPAAAAPAAPARAERPFAQAAFCIDVRSEIFRRALETVAPEVRTLGFAGFFGFPIEYIPIGRDTGGAQCPVLLTPKFRVRETVIGASAGDTAEVMQFRRVRRRASAAWKAFKTSAVSCFAFVEGAGVTFAGKLAGATLGWTRPVPHPGSEGLDAATRARVGPEIDHHADGAHTHSTPTGFDADEKLAMAEAVLRAMSMTEGFARLVLLAGHGSTTANNPHATGLDCGACGGHTGEANARVAAAILNDAAVRTGLRSRGLHVPGDTWFIAALHDTTADEVRLYDAHLAPAALGAEIAQLERQLARAGQLARAQRAALLGLGDAAPATVDADIARRTRDWSEVRPEWGLAGNAAFVAAPRHRTRGLDLAGRAFLHEYEWQQDRTWSTLELIMTAPMVVASWINLQYYGSTVDNDAFGSGNKVLHNVVGATIGVLEGNGGDLRVGLPVQSVHDGERFVHEPLRLNVFIEAPRTAVQDVVAKHAGVRQLLNNGWVHLFVIEDDGATFARYVPGGGWEQA
jgi:uncharacterized protein YbcC (UPF0753/DUF2309 family)